MPACTYFTQVVLPSAARTTSGVSDIIVVPPDVKQMKFLLVVSGFGGAAPTLDVAIEEIWDLDGTNVFLSLGSFSQKTGVVNSDGLNVTNPFTHKIRANYGIGGGGGQTFTFKVHMLGKS